MYDIICDFLKEKNQNWEKLIYMNTNVLVGANKEINFSVGSGNPVEGGFGVKYDLIKNQIVDYYKFASEDIKQEISKKYEKVLDNIFMFLSDYNISESNLYGIGLDLKTEKCNALYFVLFDYFQISRPFKNPRKIISVDDFREYCSGRYYWDPSKKVKGHIKFNLEKYENGEQFDNCFTITVHSKYDELPESYQWLLNDFDKNEMIKAYKYTEDDLGVVEIYDPKMKEITDKWNPNGTRNLIR